MVKDKYDKKKKANRKKTDRNKERRLFHMIRIKLIILINY